MIVGLDWAVSVGWCLLLLYKMNTLRCALPVYLGQMLANLLDWQGMHCGKALRTAYLMTILTIFLIMLSGVNCVYACSGGILSYCLR